MTVPHRAASAALLAFSLVVGLAGCDVFGSGDDTTLADQLRQNEARWEQRGVVNYRMDMIVARLTTEEAFPMRLTVRNGEIVSMADAETGEPFTPTGNNPYMTVEEMFDLIREALAVRVPGIFVGYDQEYGFPDEFQIDYDARRLDDDILVIVTNFVRQD